MDSLANLAKGLGVTPRKLALIGVLAVVLAGLLVYQYGRFGGSEMEEMATAVPPTNPPRIVTTAQTKPAADSAEESLREAAAAAATKSINEQLWTAPELASVIEYDPLAVPAAFPLPVQAAASGQGGGADSSTISASHGEQLTSLVEDLQMQLEELRQRGVHVIVKERDKYVAVIGDRTIHVGDEINGFTVTAIAPDGVRVERKTE
jgi:hypothetical protein